MSDDNNKKSPKPNPLKTQPLKKTSAVPLRKETVRVTLKAPGSPPATPAPAPTIPLAGGVPKPPAAKSMTPDTAKVDAKPPANVDLPDVTSAVPLKQETMRVTLKAGEEGGAPGAPPAAPKAPSAPAPAPTIPLGGGVPKPAAAAPTVKLATSPATIPLATQPLGGASQQLPKATVQLQQTQQLTTPIAGGSQVATIQTASDDDIETSEGQGLAIGLSVAAFLVSLILLWLSLDHASVWIDDKHDGDMMKIID